jgi:nucleoporin p58/p45
MGQSTAATQQTAPGGKVDLANAKGSTRVGDLTEELQLEIATIDMIVNNIMEQQRQIAAFLPQHGKDVEQLTNDVTFLEGKLKGVQAALEEDVRNIQYLKDMTKQDIEDAQLSFKAVDNLKLPAHYHQPSLFGGNRANAGSANASQGGTDETGDILALYARRTLQLKEKHEKLLEKMRACEEHMPGVENGLYERMRRLQQGAIGVGMGSQFEQIFEAIRETGSTIYRLANNIAENREKLEGLKLLSAGRRI